MSDSDQSAPGEQPTPPAPVQPRYGEYAPQQPHAQPQYQQPYAQPQYQQPYAQPPHQQQYPAAYPAQQYAPGGYAPYVPPQPRGLSITAMVLGLVSILFWFTLLVPVGGLVLGIMGLKREPAGRGMAITGIVLSALCLLGVVLVVVFGIIAMIIAAGTAATVGSTYSSVNP